jgi:putative ABC transport system permease protein
VRLQLALRNVLRHRRRSATALVAIASGVAALILAGGFNDWNFWTYRELAIRSQFGHIRVHHAGYSESGVADPFAYLLPDKAPERGTIASMPHVTVLAPRLSLSGLVSRGESTLSFIGEGVDPSAERELSRALLIVEGENLAAEDPTGIIVGRGLAENLGAHVGDVLVLLANTNAGGLNAVEVRVRGTFSTVTKAYDDAALRLPIATAQQLLRVSGAHAWVLLLDDTRYTAPTVEALRKAFDRKSFEFVPWWQLADFYNKSAALMDRQISVIKVIIAVLIILSISNTLLMSVMERTGEIGTSMALGVTRMQVLRQFLTEGIVLGALGALAGALIGSTLGVMISAIGFPVPPPPGMAREFPGGIRVTALLVAGAFNLGVVTTLAASVYPAWRASRLQIVDALRHNR